MNFPTADVPEASNQRAAPGAPDDRLMREPLVPTVPIRLIGGWSGPAAVVPPPSSHPRGHLPASLPSAAEWPALLERLLNSPSQLPDYATLKHSTGAEVFRAELTASAGPIPIIVKRSRPRGWRRRLAFALRGGRERHNFDAALRLLRSGINVPMPLAALQRSTPDCEACLVSAFVPDLIDLDRVVMSELPRLAAPEARRIKLDIIVVVVALLRRLQAHGLTHRDFKASNVMLRHWDGRSGPISVWLVDLDGIRPVRARAMWGEWHPIVRLAASLAGYAAVTAADRLRFLRCWMGGPSADRSDVSRRYRDLSRRVVTYNRRARRRKSEKLDGYVGD